MRTEERTANDRGWAVPVDYKPRLPEQPLPGVGIVGVGGIVKQAHLPAYNRYGISVVGAFDVNPAATEGVREAFEVSKVYASLDDLLGDPAITIVDIATFPAERAALVHHAIEAGKHVLSQKPLALDMDTARGLVETAERRRVKLAVNQNGRWAPSWRVATLLVSAGAIGDVISIAHRVERSYRWTIDTHFERIPHWAIYDYAVHWVDICRCWLEGKQPVEVRARDFRSPNQPPESLTPWGFWIEIACADGTSASIRGSGNEPVSDAGHPFVVHGTEGAIRGGVLGNDYVELVRDGATIRYDLEGEWFPDGFAGTMGELMTAIAEDREPFNSARHNLLSLELTLAAVRSAEENGTPVSIRVEQ